MAPVALAAILVLALVLIVAIYKLRHGACKTDTDCPSGQSCLGGSCQVSTGQCNPPCSAPFVCQNGSCVSSGQCAPPCASPQTCVNGACQMPSWQCSPACVPPQACIDGVCQAPQSCYSWLQWPTSETPPEGAIGYNPSPNSMQLPVGAQPSPGAPFYLGVTSMNNPPDSPDWGLFMAPPSTYSFSPPSMWYLAAAEGCSTTLAPTTVLSQAIQFNGMPVCWDFTGATGSFSAYQSDTGACDQWPLYGGNYQLVADQVMPAGAVH